MSRHNKENQSAIDKLIDWFITLPSDRNEDEITVTDIAKKLDVSRYTIYNWMRTPYFQEEVTRLTSANRSTDIAKVKQACLQKALSGDPQAMKLFKEWIAEVEDVLRIKGEVSVDLKGLIKAAESQDEPDKE